MHLIGRCIPAFQKVAVWPFDVIIQEYVPHHALEFIHRKKSTRTIEEVSACSIGVPPKAVGTSPRMLAMTKVEILQAGRNHLVLDRISCAFGCL